MFFSFFLVGQQIKALSFTRLTAQQLGERLLRWSGHYGQNYVDSEKVWKCKKKNKGVKRQHWWAAVKEFHNQGGPDGQHLDGSDNQNKPPGDDGLDGAPPSAAPIDKSAMPVRWDFSDAPWNKKPRIEVVEDDKTTKTGAEADRKKEKEDGKSSSSQPEEGKVRIFGPWKSFHRSWILWCVTIGADSLCTKPGVSFDLHGLQKRCAVGMGWHGMGWDENLILLFQEDWI